MKHNKRGEEFNDDFELFMKHTVATQNSRLGNVVMSYFNSPMVKEYKQVNFSPEKNWGYDVRDSDTGVFDGGWAHILVIERYNWEKHSHFRCLFSNTMPFLSERFSSKPLVIFVSKKNENFKFIEQQIFFEIDVNDSLDEKRYKQNLSELFLSNKSWLEGISDKIVETFHRRIDN